MKKLETECFAIDTEAIIGSHSKICENTLSSQDINIYLPLSFESYLMIKFLEQSKNLNYRKHELYLYSATKCKTVDLYLNQRLNNSISITRLQTL